MSDYQHADDGKLHTRYSELKQVSSVTAEKAAMRHLGLLEGFQNDATAFGTVRHDMWAEECRETGKLPSCFGIDMAVTHVEQEFVTEIFKGIILHSRCDAVSADDGVVWDFKTMVYNPSIAIADHARKYRNDRQLPTYCLQLAINKLTMKKYGYLVEVWNERRDEILGYSVLIQNVDLMGLGAVRTWLLDKVTILKVALDLYAQN